MMQFQKSKTKHKLEFQAIGTRWTIDADIAADVTKKILKKIDEFDKNYSRFRTDSLVTKISLQPGTYELPSDAKLLIDFYHQLYDATGGLVTPMIGSVMEEAGYDKQLSFQSKKLHSPPAWDNAIDFNFPKLTTSQPIQLDFGAAGKGYLVDIISQLLHENNIFNYCINAGGDMLIKGQPKIVGLENPDDFSQAIGSVTVVDEAICASAGNRRKWADFHHTINPKTLQSPTSVKAIWVRAKTTMLADGIATALYFIDPVKLHEQFTFEHAIIKEDDSIEFSQGFNATYF